MQIVDDGIGMDKDDIAAVFSPFYQATPSSEGSGVGLSICRKIAEGLGGRVWLASAGRDKGTTAHVVLPLEQEAAE